MPIRTSRATALSVLRRVAGLVLMACATTAHAGDMPERGMTKASVERAFGAPEQKRAPVGQPPISRWVYPDFTVYFEGDYALHAVSHHPPPAPARAPEVVSGPAPATPDTEAPNTESRAEYRFDPATGQIIPLDDTAPQAEPAPAASMEAETTPAEQTAEPAAEPPAAAPTDAPAEQEDGKRPARFRFDPASGRIIMDDGQPPATANPGSASAPATAEPEQDTAPDTAPAPEAATEPAPAPESAPAEQPDTPADTGGGFRMEW